MKEILKEIAPGTFTHDYWVDDEGNKIINEIPSKQKSIEDRLIQLEDLIVFGLNIPTR